MLKFKGFSGSNAKAVLEALGKSLAIIEFDPTGTILSANPNFCSALGYTLQEIEGRHHSMFVEPEYARSPEYKAFWAKLGRGEFDAREYKRIGKGGREVWIQASYNPVVNAQGNVLKVVKVATDITAEKFKNVETAGKLAAISRAQAIIQFTPEGEVITANENFLNVMGYRLDEIKGKHHRLFVDPPYAQSSEYQEFWKKLNRGEYVAAEFKRIGKGGKEVWIQASYYPISDLNNKVSKIVKFATDVTGRVRAVNEIGAGLARLAERDLSHRIDKPFGADFEKLRLDFNLSLDRLRTALESISNSSQTIRAGTREITTSTDDLASRTEQQAARLEESSAALREITATVARSAEGTSHARKVVSAADENAKKSAVVVGEAIAAMDGIAKSSQQITQIIGVIDEIAFQTNLLALNAGVEAARAGEAGRGFAVVASEVRALAQRSAEAAKEIKNLISTSTNQVSEGVKLVGNTGKSLEDIKVQVAEINNIVTEMAVGAKEQAKALEDISATINEMDKTTQQNAAMVEETTAASHSMSEETSRLSDLISEFEIGRAHGQSAVLRLVPHTPQPPSKAQPVRVARPKARIAAAPPAPARKASPAAAANTAYAVNDTNSWEEF